jgi:hypothetical protein
VKELKSTVDIICAEYLNGLKEKEINKGRQEGEKKEGQQSKRI